jgi:hypothetical protein
VFRESSISVNPIEKQREEISKRMAMATLIKEETLNRLFNCDLKKKYIDHTGRCDCCCGSDIVITIERTSGGYGFKGGVLYEEATDQFLIQCEHCFKENGTLSHPKDMTKNLLETVSAAP